MSPLNFTVVALLAFVGGYFAHEYVFELKLEPKISFENLNYNVTIRSPHLHNLIEYQKENHHTEEERNEKSVNFDLIEYALEKLPVDLQIFVKLRNTKENEFQIWPNAFTKKVAVREGEKTHRIRFGNYFKLAISPPLTGPDSNDIYRVDIYCAGAKPPAEFSSVTQSDLMVVLNSEEKKCKDDKYDIFVWKLQKNQLKNMTGKIMPIDSQSKKERAIEIENGKIYRFIFENSNSPKFSRQIVSPRKDGPMQMGSNNGKEGWLPSPKRKSTSANTAAMNKEQEWLPSPKRKNANAATMSKEKQWIIIPSPKNDKSQHNSRRPTEAETVANREKNNYQKEMPSHNELLQSEKKESEEAKQEKNSRQKPFQKKVIQRNSREEQMQIWPTHSDNGIPPPPSPNVQNERIENEKEEIELKKMTDQVEELKKNIEMIKKDMEEMDINFKTTIFELNNFLNANFVVDREKGKTQK